MLNFTIGIQARSTSTRLPRKILLPIDNKPILKHVIDNCNNAAKFINTTLRNKAHCSVVVLCPTGDELISHFSNIVDIVEGPEEDVLSRYKILSDKYKSDYIVRVTSDCLFLPPFIVSRLIKQAVKYEHHFTCNVIHRTEKEGFDCEILSSALLDYLDKTVTSDYHREHVTSYIAESVKNNTFPFDDFHFKICHVIDKINLSYIETSIDTEEDYNNAVKMFKNINSHKEKCLETGMYVI